MSKIPEDPFRPDKESEKKATKNKIINPRCVAEIEINDLHHDLFLFNRRTKNGITDDWVFIIWIVGVRSLYRAYYTEEIGIWTNILRGVCINEPNFLYSITKDAIDLADEMIARNIDIVNGKEYRKGIYNIIRRHREFIVKYKEITIQEKGKNPAFIEQLDNFFPRGKCNIIGYIIAVSAIYYACRIRPVMDENMPTSWDILEYCIIKAIEGIGIDEILDYEGTLIGRRDTYYGKKGVHEFEKLLEKYGNKRDIDVIKWRMKHKIV